MTQTQPSHKLPRLTRDQVRTLTDAQTCGTCSLCCRVLEIKEEEDKNFKYKPYNTWCTHCKPGNWPGGCSRHDDQPEACSAFECIWLQSHKRRDVISMPPSMKPSKSHVVLVQSQTDYFVLFAFCDPKRPSAWRDEPMRSHLIRVAEAGCTVIVVVDTDRYVMTKGRATILLKEGQLDEMVNIRLKGGHLQKAAKDPSLLREELLNSAIAISPPSPTSTSNQE